LHHQHQQTVSQHLKHSAHPATYALQFLHVFAAKITGYIAPYLSKIGLQFNKEINLRET
jgi:hypothetical protein